MSDSWPALDAVLAHLGTAPTRTGSVIATVYGDAIQPRGGSLLLADLLQLMRRLGASDGVVRTAVSRLAKDGVLQGRRAGRRAPTRSPRLPTPSSATAVPLIYGSGGPAWDGRLHLAFPEPGADRSGLDAAGYALLAPGVLVSPLPAPGSVLGSVPGLGASGPASAMRQLAARAWPLARLAEAFTSYADLMRPLWPVPALDPLDAMAARIVVIHAWRRIALRDPRLPAGLLPADWPGRVARRQCTEIYAAVAPASEAWLSAASAGETALPPGPDPRDRFEQAPQTTTPSPEGEGAP